MIALILVVALVSFDLNSIRNEPNLEKRSEMALDNANAAIDAAEQAYNAGEVEKMRADLQEVADSVDLAYQSLLATGKSARHEKGFKKAEQRTHEMVRRLDGFRELVDVDDRPSVAKVRDRVAAVNDNLLNGIMKKK